jgi:cobalt-precorrin-5B (C1)-methyltransferase
MKVKKLRLGYTTGTAAAAAAKAAAIMLVTKNKINKITIETPAGITFNLEVFDQKIGKEEARCCVIKDAGDDPDITNGMKICARVKEKENEITIKGGEGIGVITKPGLSIPVGSSAINPMPLKMIKHEVEKIVSSKKGLEVTITAPEGREKAKKTFNSRLGIKEGISIIGTTGIVRPMSEASWKTSLMLQLDVVLASGFKTIVLTPGNIGERVAKEKFFVPQEKIVQTGNWIGEMLDACAVKGARKILLIGHIGKLIKIVNGHFDTKNARGESPRIISNLIRSLGCPAELAESIAMCNTAEEAIFKIDESETYLLNLMAEKVREKVEERIGNHLTAGVILASLTGKVTGMEDNARLILTEINSRV